jgi:hypothetical protein
MPQAVCGNTRFFHWLAAVDFDRYWDVAFMPLAWRRVGRDEWNSTPSLAMGWRGQADVPDPLLFRMPVAHTDHARIM